MTMRAHQLFETACIKTCGKLNQLSATTLYVPEELPTQWQLPRSWGFSEVELLQVEKGDVPPEQKSVFQT